MWRTHVVEVHGQDPQTGDILSPVKPDDAVSGHGIKRKADSEVALPSKKQRHGLQVTNLPRDASRSSVEPHDFELLIDPSILSL